jgi:AraC family transcriptional regulator
LLRHRSAVCGRLAVGTGRKSAAEGAHYVVQDNQLRMTHCQRLFAQLSGKNAFVITLHLRDRPNHEYWEDGRRALVCDFRAGEISLRDLKRDPSALLDKPYHSLLFYLSREALNAIADDVSAPRIGDLNHKPGSGIEDATIFRLGSSVLPALSRPDQANRLFVDHVTLAVGIHVAQTYGGMRPVSRRELGASVPPLPLARKRNMKKA